MQKRVLFGGSRKYNTRISIGQTVSRANFISAIRYTSYNTAVLSPVCMFSGSGCRKKFTVYGHIFNRFLQKQGPFCRYKYPKSFIPNTGLFLFKRSLKQIVFYLTTRFGPWVNSEGRNKSRDRVRDQISGPKFASIKMVLKTRLGG